MRECVFAGTFDPFTVGHRDVVDKCLKMFDKVHVAVLNNHDKKPLFSGEQRVKSIEKIFKGDPRVVVEHSDGLLVDFMKEKNISVNVRGIRNAEDFKYETNMFYYNQEMYPELITVYLPASLSKTHISSTSIRMLINAGADISPYVPAEIAGDVTAALKDRK
mgnify:CR=1 FL=1